MSNVRTFREGSNTLRVYLRQEEVWGWTSSNPAGTVYLK